MRSGRVLIGLLGIAALTALVFAWPAIAGLGRKPRIGDWVPETDPGTLLAVVDGDRFTHALGLGTDNFSSDLTCVAPLGYRRLAVQVYSEADGVLGAAGERQFNRFENSAVEPSPTESISAYGGYHSDVDVHLEAEVEFSDGLVIRNTVAAPIHLHNGGTTAWQTLAAIEHLGVLLEWSQTPAAILVRRSALPDRLPRAWSGGGFQIGDQGTQFVADTQIASMLRARVPSQPLGEQNVSITVISAEQGVFTNIRVK